MRAIGRIGSLVAICAILSCTAGAQTPQDSGAYLPPGSSASAQALTQAGAPSIWQPTLDAARQVAARTDRLVLVYFYADWCPACRTMDEELSASGAMAQLQQYYVPVKVNADFFPATAKQYGVTGLPTTVVITPQGQAIDGIRGRLDAPKYVARLNQVALDARRAAPAQAARNWPATNLGGAPADPGALTQRPTEQPRQQYGVATSGNMGPAAPPTSAPFNPQLAQRPLPGGAPPVDPFSRHTPELAGQATFQPPAQRDWAGQPAPSNLTSRSAPAIPPSAPQGAAWPTAQPTTQHRPLAGGGPWNSGDNWDSGRLPQQPGAASLSEPVRNNPSYPAPDASAVSGAVTASSSVYARWTNNWASTSPSGGLPPHTPHAATGTPTSTAAQTGGTPMAGTGGPAPAYAQPSTQQQPASAAATVPISIPPGNPPLGLDGYCPVCLVEKQKWVLGDRAWGVIHRGRTYLFDSPEDRAKFFADPDRYAPVMSGQDVVYALESGKLVPGYRRHGVYFGNRVYLFADEASLQKFSQNPHHYAAQALAATRSAASPHNWQR